MYSFRFVVLVAVLAAVAAALLIYLTPLKQINLVAPPMRDMDPAAFWKEYSAHPDAYIFYDVRTPQEYAVNHAKGALNEPIQLLYPDHANLPHSGKTIVLMCSGGYLSAVAYGYLQDQGFSNLIHIQGGLKQWIIEGLPIESGPSTATSTAE